MLIAYQPVLHGWFYDTVQKIGLQKWLFNYSNSVLFYEKCYRPYSLPPYYGSVWSNAVTQTNGQRCYPKSEHINKHELDFLGVIIPVWRGVAWHGASLMASYCRNPAPPLRLLWMLFQSHVQKKRGIICMNCNLSSLVLLRKNICVMADWVKILRINIFLRSFKFMSNLKLLPNFHLVYWYSKRIHPSQEISTYLSNKLD